MKNKFGFYAICWAILLALFNVIVFVTPNEAAGLSKFGGAFWVGYIFITLAFIGQLSCTYFAFKAKNAKKHFYKLPLITVSYSGLILTLIVGSLCMVLPNLPNWVGIIACLLILVFNAITLVKATAAAAIVEETDRKIEIQTGFMKSLAAKAETLAASTEDPVIKTECKKVFEEAKYSDPTSSPALAEIEGRIAEKTGEFAAAVQSGDAETVKRIAAETIALIKERNILCRSGK